MARLKHLLVAVLTAAAGAYYLHDRATGEATQIKQVADSQLKVAPAAIANVVGADNQALLAQLKGLQLTGLAEAMDDEGKPTAEALEAARTAVERSTPADSERPVLVVVAAQGVGGRYRLGQSNRFDANLAAFPALAADQGPLPRAGIGILDGELCRFAVTQFDDSKVENAKGILALAFPIDDGLAKRFQNAIGPVDVILLQKDKVIGSTLPPTERQALQTAAGSNKGLFDFGTAAGQTYAGLPLPLFTKPVKYRASVLPAGPGLPADVKVIVTTRILDRFATLIEDQKAMLGFLAALVALSLLLMALTGNPARGLARVVSAAERLAQEDAEARAPTDKMTPLVRRLAVAINSLAVKVSSSPAPSPPSFADQLGIRSQRGTPSQPPPGPAAPAVETSPSLLAAAPLPGSGLADVDSFLSGSSVNEPTAVLAPPVPVPRQSSGLGSPPAPAPSFSSPSFSAPAPSFSSPSIPSPSFSSPSFPAPSSSGSQASFMKPKPTFSMPSATVPPIYQPPAPASGPDEFAADQTVIAQTPEALIRATQRSLSSFSNSPASSPPSSASSAVPLPPPSTSSEEAHFQQIFKEFVSTREKCHEPADGLTFEKFSQKLRKNQEQLVQKYQCRTVRFQVYVKDGKAALKATPVR